ncbi:MAG: hypothetical protein ACTSQA_00585 [Candidatus Heimdallarchaeaceae archaeon]
MIKSLLSPLPGFNLSDEMEDECQLCKIKVPAKLHFISPVFVGDAYRDLCPRCALGIRNLLLHLPKTARYSNEASNEWYNQFISWLIQERIE